MEPPQAEIINPTKTQPIEKFQSICILYHSFSKIKTDRWSKKRPIAKWATEVGIGKLTTKNELQLEILVE